MPEPEPVVEERAPRDVSDRSTVQVADSTDLDEVLDFDTSASEQITVDRDQIYWDANTTVVPIYDKNGFIVGYTDSGTADSVTTSDTTTYGGDGSATTTERETESPAEPSSEAVWVEVPDFDEFGNFIGFKTVLQEPEEAEAESAPEEDTTGANGGTPMEVPDFDDFGNFIGFKTIYV